MSLFTVPTNDYVSHMMGMVFGSAWSTVQSLGLGAASSNSSATGYLGQMFLIYNTAILTVVTIYITKVLFEGAVGTAHKGEWFGKMYSTFWMPLRMFLMLGMLAPVLGGYCFGQVAVLFAVNTGIGVADDLANTGISAVIKTGVVSPPANVPSQRSTANNVFRIAACESAIAADPAYANISGGAVSAVNSNGIQEFGGTAATGISPTACGTINTTGLTSTQMAAFQTLENTIFGMQAQGQPIGEIITRVYGSQGTGANNAQDNENGGTGIFTTAQNNLLTTAAGNFEQSLYSVYANPSTSSMTSNWTSQVSTYGFAALAPLMLDISTYDASINAAVGQGPIITPPSISGTQSIASVMNLANRYINNHNTAPVVSPVVTAASGTLLGYQLPAQPSVGEWMVSPFSAIKASINYELTKHLINPVVSQLNSITVSNPLGSIQDFGQGILYIGTGTFTGLMAVDGIATAAEVVGGGKAVGTGVNSTPIAIFLSTFVITILAGIVLPIILFGVLAAYIIPMMPYTVMIMAVIGYVAAVAVAMVGAPLWIAAHAVPSGEGFVSDRSKAGYSLLLSLFAKPPLIVFGFFLALAMFSAGVWLINNTFLTAIGVVLGNTYSSAIGTIGAATGAGGAAGAVVGGVAGGAVGAAVVGTVGAAVAGAAMTFIAVIAFIIGLLTMLFIFVSLYITLAKWSFGLINLVPDNALSWIGLQDINMHEDDKHNDALIVGAYGGSRAGINAFAGKHDAGGRAVRDADAKDKNAANQQKAQEAQAKRDKTQEDIASGLRSMGSGSGGGEGTGDKGGQV